MLLTPSAINKYIKSIIDNDKYLRDFVITGEVSNVKHHSNGNIYFRIKDESAQIDCTMFASLARKNQFKLADGQQIEAHVAISTIVKMGKYSLNVKSVKLSGTGRLYEIYKELFKKLESEGLFASDLKQNIPAFPKRIGIVTSPTGAAIQDILTTLKRRHPLSDVVIIPCLVQGENATKDIVTKLKKADLLNFDVLITGRGGGSIEDLWCFNEEEVVRTIFNLKTPVITSIGHETDTTLSDYVSDVRAATPTAAAELAACDLNAVKNQVNKNLNYITNNVNQRLKLNKTKLEYVKKSQVLTMPLFPKQIIHDNLNNQLSLTSHNLASKLTKEQYKIKHLNTMQIMNQKLQESTNGLEKVHIKVDQLNPLVILSRGYATVKSNSKYVKTINDVNIDENLDIKMQDGTIKTRVIAKEKNEDI